MSHSGWASGGNCALVCVCRRVLYFPKYRVSACMCVNWYSVMTLPCSAVSPCWCALSTLFLLSPFLCLLVSRTWISMLEFVHMSEKNWGNLPLSGFVCKCYSPIQWLFYCLITVHMIPKPSGIACTMSEWCTAMESCVNQLQERALRQCPGSPVFMPKLPRDILIGPNPQGHSKESAGYSGLFVNI